MTNFLAGMAVCAVLFQRLDVASVWFVAAALSSLLSDFRCGDKARAGK
jgi:hypothetical protein